MLFFRVSHVEQLNAWGVAPTKGAAEAHAQAWILAQRPDLAKAKSEQVGA